MKTRQFQPQSSVPLALDVVGFLAQDPERFSLFVALTGLGPADFKAHLADRGFQAMILDYVLQDQSLVLEFTTAQGLAPGAVLAARRALPGPAEG